MRPVTTAIIMAGGYGTRMLPITAGVQKELLPVLNRPIVDYVVADLVHAGIKRVIFVVRPSTHALQDYYLGQPSLQQHLERFDKNEALSVLEAVHHQAAFEFIEQPSDAGYGTAVPLRIARPYLSPDETVVVSSGDDFLYHPDGGEEISNMLGLLTDNVVGVVTGLERPDSQLHKYGVLKTKEVASGELLTGLIEKPAAGTAPTNLTNISKYVMTPTMLDYVERLQPDHKTGEYLVTDAILSCAQEHNVAVYRASGRYLDTGSLGGWLEANITVAENHPELREVLARALEAGTSVIAKR